MRKLDTVSGNSSEAWARADVRRMLKLSERQLRSWETQGHVTPGAVFGFSDLLALKTLRKLRGFDSYLFWSAQQRIDRTLF